MGIYLLAVIPLTFYATCAFLRESSPIVPLDLWRRFALGALLGLPGFLIAGFVAGWFDASYRPLALFVRLAFTLHIVPSALAVTAVLALRFVPAFVFRRVGIGDGETLSVMATMGGFGSSFVAADFASSDMPASAVLLLSVPTLRVAVLIALIFAWTRRGRPLVAAGIVMCALLFAGAISYLYVIGFHVPAGLFTGFAAAAGVFTLVSLRRST